MSELTQAERDAREDALYAVAESHDSIEDLNTLELWDAAWQAAKDYYIPSTIREFTDKDAQNDWVLTDERLEAVHQTLNEHDAPTHDAQGNKLNANGRLVEFLVAKKPDAARTDLLAYMENWSEETFAAGWLTDLADTMADMDAEKFRPLVETAGGWYVYRDGPEFVPGTWDELLTNGSGERK